MSIPKHDWRYMYEKENGCGLNQTNSGKDYMRELGFKNGGIFDALYLSALL